MYSRQKWCYHEIETKPSGTLGYLTTIRTNEALSEGRTQDYENQEGSKERKNYGISNPKRGALAWEQIVHH